MMNFLRLRNGYSGIRGLQTFCVSANLIALTVEMLRFGLFGGWIFEEWRALLLAFRFE